jgi:hypothetical protein
LNKQNSRRILENLRLESILDIHHLFEESNPPEDMGDFFSPLEFTAIVGYPHVVTEKAIEKLPSF